VNGDDVRVAQPVQHLRLGQHALDFRPGRAHLLERDLPPEQPVPGKVHHARRAVPQHIQAFVFADGSNRRGHVRFVYFAAPGRADFAEGLVPPKRCGRAARTIFTWLKSTT
jgi:hypothetical protein